MQHCPPLTLEFMQHFPLLKQTLLTADSMQHRPPLTVDSIQHCPPLTVELLYSLLQVPTPEGEGQLLPPTTRRATLAYTPSPSVAAAPAAAAAAAPLVPHKPHQAHQTSRVGHSRVVVHARPDAANDSVPAICDPVPAVGDSVPAVGDSVPAVDGATAGYQPVERIPAAGTQSGMVAVPAGAFSLGHVHLSG